MANFNAGKDLNTDWHKMQVIELLAAANISSPGSELGKRLNALYGSVNNNFDQYPMEIIINEIDTKKKSGNAASALYADNALICLAKTFVEVNRQVLNGCMPSTISYKLRSFYYVIFTRFSMFTDYKMRRKIITLIFLNADRNRECSEERNKEHNEERGKERNEERNKERNEEHPEEFDEELYRKGNDLECAARYFPLVHIISGLLETINYYESKNQTNSKKYKKAIEYLYQIIVMDMFAFNGKKIP